MARAKLLKPWLPAIRAGSGADVFTERLAAALIRRGVAATISWFPHWAEFAPDVLRSARPPAGARIVHSNSAYAFAFHRAGMPLIATEHHYVLDPAYRPYKSFAQTAYHRLLVAQYLRRSYAAADVISTDSRFTAGVLERIAGVRAARTIPLWVDYELFSPVRLDRSARRNGRFRLLFVGNASRRKGADVVPLLAERLGAEFELRCTAGLRDRANASAMENVRVLGRLGTQALVDEYRTCDAVLVPSRYEGFGYTALEAMACAKPVVGFRCGAVAEVVEQGKTALLSDIDDLDALEANCRLLAVDRERAIELGIAGRKRAVGTFSESAALDMYIELYRSLLD